MIIKIEVTQEDIDKGQSRQCLYCPVALAIADKIDLSNYTVVACVETAYFYKKPFKYSADHIYAINFPVEVSNFIVRFDRLFENNPKIKPFSFRLDIPQEFLKDDKAISTSDN